MAESGRAGAAIVAERKSLLTASLKDEDYEVRKEAEHVLDACRDDAEKQLSEKALREDWAQNCRGQSQMES